MLNKTQRLKKKKEIALVLKKGRFISGRFFSGKFLLNKTNPLTKVAFLCPKKTLPKATQRNKAKRKMRGVVRNFLPKMKNGLWLVLFLRDDILTIKSTHLVDEVFSCFQKANLFKASEK